MNTVPRWPACSNKWCYTLLLGTYVRNLYGIVSLEFALTTSKLTCMEILMALSTDTSMNTFYHTQHNSWYMYVFFCLFVCLFFFCCCFFTNQICYFRVSERAIYKLKQSDNFIRKRWNKNKQKQDTVYMYTVKLKHQIRQSTLI